MSDEKVVQMFAKKTGENASGPPRVQDPRYAQLLVDILNLVGDRASESGGLSIVGVLGTIRLVELELMIQATEGGKSIGDLLK